MKTGRRQLVQEPVEEGNFFMVPEIDEEYEGEYNKSGITVEEAAIGHVTITKE